MVALLAMVAVLLLSWAITCMFVFLICLCFGVQFTFMIGTGVWLTLCMLKVALGVNNKSK